MASGVAASKAQAVVGIAAMLLVLGSWGGCSDDDCTITRTCGAPDCVEHGDCTDAGLARCEKQRCVPCQESADCVGVDGLAVCVEGECKACALGEEAGCVAPQTCDLLENTCVDVAPESLGVCAACSNDAQCEAGHFCIPLDFPVGTPHGHYCMFAFVGNCDRPFRSGVNRASVSGASAREFCGINEDLTTCEAVNALKANWRCGATQADGRCMPLGGAEVDVPGARCEVVSTTLQRCTYACENEGQCPLVPSLGSTCGTGDQMAPGWCGG